MASLAYNVDFSQWRRAFEQIQHRAANPEPAHEDIGDKLVSEIKDNIEAQGGPESWDALKPATLEERRRKHPEAGDKMLIVTRELIDSITKSATPDYVDGGSPLPKAKTLFFGRGPVPARFPFRWRSGFLASIARIYLEYLFARLK